MNIKATINKLQKALIQPTAYDLDMVVEQLKEWESASYRYMMEDEGMSHAYSSEVRHEAWKEALEIVQSGVVANNAQEAQAKKIIIVNSSNEKENVSVGDFVIYKCPNCGKKIGSAFHYPPNEHMMEHKFCDGCGQKFKWSWE